MLINLMDKVTGWQKAEIAGALASFATKMFGSIETLHEQINKMTASLVSSLSDQNHYVRLYSLRTMGKFKLCKPEYVQLYMELLSNPTETEEIRIEAVKALSECQVLLTNLN